MIRNLTILLLLSLSYSQPETEWTQVSIPSNQNIVKLISDENGLYGATSTTSIYFSSNNGLNWESLPLPPDIFPYGVDLFEKVDDYLFFNQNIGGSTYNYRTYFNGENWEDWEILPYDESIIYEFVHYDNTIYALLNQGISVSSDYGTSWELIDIPSITGYIHLQYVDNQYLYINHGCILYRYNIETFEWVDITGILDDIGPPEPYSCTSIHQIIKFNEKLLISMYWYGGVGTLFYSQNNGDSWEIINSFPSLSNSGYGTNNVPAVVTKNGILYAGTATSEDGIYYTQNLIDWTEYSSGLSNYNLSVSALAATEENIYKLGGSVNLFQNELIGVSDNIYGCTDPEATNYNPDATVDDGSCCIELWGVCYSIENTTELDLEDSGIIGEIPPEIGNLVNLINLDLSYNQLTSSIPSEMGNLVNLKWINLEWSQISGEIPPEIGNLLNLEHLVLEYNQLSGKIPPEIGNLTNLNGLLLGENYFNGIIPSGIGNLVNLIHLGLEDNQLSGEIPENICDIYQNLWWFRISYNKLCPPYPDCGEGPITSEAEQDTSECSPECDLGDMNCDGGLNILDITALVNMILGNTDGNDAADVNADGAIDVMDLVTLVNWILNGN